MAEICVFGRYPYAVGKNEEAARFSGIRTGRVIAAYADFRERREKLRRLADGGAAAPVEPAIDADARIASSASTKCSAADDLRIFERERPGYDYRSPDSSRPDRLPISAF